MSFCAFGMLLEKINVFLSLELTGIFCLETFKSDTPRFVYNEILPSSQLFGVFMVSPFFFLSCLLPFCYSQHLAVAVVFSRNFARHDLAVLDYLSDFICCLSFSACPLKCLELTREMDPMDLSGKLRNCIPLETNMSAWKIPMFNRKHILKGWISHCHVSFRELYHELLIDIAWCIKGTKWCIGRSTTFQHPQLIPTLRLSPLRQNGMLLVFFGGSPRGSSKLV